jgi:hypothetical protein
MCSSGIVVALPADTGAETADTLVLAERLVRECRMDGPRTKVV